MSDLQKPGSNQRASESEYMQMATLAALNSGSYAPALGEIEAAKVLSEESVHEHLLGAWGTLAFIGLLPVIFGIPILAG